MTLFTTGQHQAFERMMRSSNRSDSSIDQENGKQFFKKQNRKPTSEGEKTVLNDAKNGKEVL